ncbi:plastocyanin-like-like protein [Stemphylium lycopersici]|uniref:Plastocyanin-like-like protein n=1 Tax=Stemphylium lycopersici TaxID=183478 RepID=A0A364NAE2_STELY|nr:hypothetical protein TW65_00082 [Stemphylium lycopersici]RAR09558.1 plastocyanin-like-like protein [Stemphylium lycopersici]RAR14232.1 plastocyanin-like-like protein [Stemphylium lycopersici]
MLAFPTMLALAVTTLFTLTSAMPASSIRTTGVVHRVYAGSTAANNGLHFEPENVVAAPGDVMEFHFLPKAHTLTQSSFSSPCTPLDAPDAIFSGFNFNTTEGEAENVFSFVVQHTNPIWYYCSQTNGDHCQKGMAGVINQDFSSDNTLARYKEMAKEAVTVQPSVDPTESRGGKILPNVPL